MSEHAIWKTGGSGMAALLALVFVTYGEQPLVLDGVAAMVNEEAITISEVMNALPRDRIGIGADAAARDRLLREAFRKMREELIDMRLIAQEARKEGARLQPWVIDQRIAEVVAERYDGDRARLLEDLAEQGVTLNEWRERLREQMMAASLRYAKIERHVAVSPGEIRDYYENHDADYQTPSGTRVRIIAIRAGGDEEGTASAERRARNAMSALEEGVSFAQTAVEFSQDAMAESGGDYGWVSPDDDLRPELAEALKALEPGQHSPVIETAEEWYIVYKEAVRDGGARPLEEVRGEILERLRREEFERLYRRWIDRLRRDARIQIFDLP